jgi:hypothetical protein
MQPADGKCPECGVPIRHTLTFPHLARSAPRWLISLVDSVTVLLVAFVLAVLSQFVNSGRDRLATLLPITAAWGTAWFAVWLLTRPEPGVRDFDTIAWAWTLRVLTTVGYLGAFLPLPVADLFRPYGTMVLIILLACLAPATCLYYNHLRRAAGRLPNRRLVLQAAALQVLLPPVTLLPLVRMFSGRGPQSQVEFLMRAPLVGVGSVGDAWTFFQILRGRYGLYDWLPFSTAPSAVLIVWAVAVLVQFRFAFAAAVRAAGGREPGPHGK